MGTCPAELGCGEGVTSGGRFRGFAESRGALGTRLSEVASLEGPQRPLPWLCHVLRVTFWVFFVKFVSQESSICWPALLDTLPTVGDALGRIPWAQDVALVTRGTEQRLGAILRGTAGLCLQHLLRAIQEPAVASKPAWLRLHQPVYDRRRWHCLQAGVGTTIVAAAPVPRALGVGLAASHLACARGQCSWGWRAAVSTGLPEAASAHLLSAGLGGQPCMPCPLPQSLGSRVMDEEEEAESPEALPPPVAAHRGRGGA